MGFFILFLAFSLVLLAPWSERTKRATQAHIIHQFTELSLSGADILEIRDFLGHSDTKVTEVYINARSILEKKVLEKLPEINLDEG